MSEKIILDAETRTVVGKKVKQLRRDGQVPAVIYGLNEPEAIQLDMLKTALTLRDSSATDVLTINLNGQERRVVSREVQRHVVRRDLIHVDFQEIDDNSMIRVQVPLRTVGRSVPEAKGLGNTLVVLRSVEVEATASTLVSELVADLALIDKPGRVLRVSDLEVPEGVTILTSESVTVAKFAVKRGGATKEES